MVFFIGVGVFIFVLRVCVTVAVGVIMVNFEDISFHTL